MVLHGVIRPPPEIRAVADRTALYVAKNGRAFESRILNSEKGKTPKFSFLHATSPFHAYYEQRIQFYEEGGSDDAEQAEQKKQEKAAEEKSSAAESAKPKVKTATITSVIDPAAKAVLDQRSKIAQLRSSSSSQEQQFSKDEDQKVAAAPVVVIPPPPPLMFVNIIAPSSLSVSQLEVIQLVAQFTAMDRQFLLQLSAREWNNPEFAFCQPRHGHFPFFSALVDAYRQVLSTWTGSASTTTSTSSSNDVKDLMNVEACLERAAYRAEYERDLEQQRNSSQASTDATVVIDWHDFVVVETIDFAVNEVVELGMMPPPPIPPPATTMTAVAVAPDDGTMDESDDEDQEQIRLVPNYQPRVVASDAKAPQYMIDPITGKSVAVQDMPEHMRIQLLDPKWAEERKKFQDKQKDSNLVSGDIVASNLERLAQARGGNKEHDLLTKESDSKKRLAEANRVIREQGQAAVGPSLPAPPAPPQQHPHLHQTPPAFADNGGEPPLKRPRVDKITTVEAPPLPSAPQRVSAPPGFDSVVVPPIDPTAAALEDPFANVGTSATTTTPSAATAPLLSESEFAASLSQPDVTLQIRVPNDRTQIAWNFYGQIVSQVINVMSTVKEVKQKLSTSHLNDMPVNKIQLKSVATGAFLKDNMTLAALNIGPTASLELVPRARGGRK